MQPAFANCGCPVLTSQWTVQILKSSWLGCHQQFHFLVEMPLVCIQLTPQDWFMSHLWKFGSLFTLSLLGCHHFSRPVEIPWKCGSTSAFLLLSMQLIVRTQLTLKKKKKPTFIFKRRLDLCLHPSFGPAEMWSYPRISRVQPIVSTLLTPQDRLSFSVRLDLSPLGFTAPRKCGPTFTCSILGCSHKSAPNWLLRLALSLHSSLLGYHQFTSPWKCGPNFAFLHTCTLQDFKIFTPREGFPFLPH